MTDPWHSDPLSIPHDTWVALLHIDNSGVAFARRDAGGTFTDEEGEEMDPENIVDGFAMWVPMGEGFVPFRRHAT